MEFVRKKKRGQNKKVQKSWFSEEGYRIIWRKEVCGVRVPARFQATVKTIIPNYGGKEGESFQMWDFTDPQHRLFKVMSKAQESCERHRRLWSKACEATGIRQIIEIFGKLPIGIPVWARKKLNRKVYAILTRPRVGKYREEEEECPETSSPDGGAPNPAAPTRTSDSSASPTEATAADPTPASPAEGGDGSTTRKTRRVRSKAISTETPSPAPPAEAPAKGRKKPAARRTSTRSKRTTKRKRTTKGSSTTESKPSKGSRKTKSKPSAS